MFVKRDDTLLIRQTHERFDLEVELEYGRLSTKVLLDDAIQADYFHEIVVAYQNGVLVDLGHVNDAQLFAHVECVEANAVFLVFHLDYSEFVGVFVFA